MTTIREISTVVDDDSITYNPATEKISSSRVALSLGTTGASVGIAASAPPTTGQVLKATGPTTATWQTPPTGLGLQPWGTRIEADQEIDPGYLYEVQVSESPVELTVNAPLAGASKVFGVSIVGTSDTNSVTLDFDGATHENPFLEGTTTANTIITVVGTFIEFYQGDDSIWRISGFRWGRGSDSGNPRPDVAGALSVNDGEVYVTTQGSDPPEEDDVLFALSANEAAWGLNVAQFIGSRETPVEMPTNEGTAGQALITGGDGSSTWDNLAVAVGDITGLGSGVATALGTFSSANIRTACSDETGTGSLVFATSPTLVTPVLGTPTSGTLTNCQLAAVSNISTNTTAVVGTIYLVDSTSGTITVTLPAVASSTGRQITVKRKTGSNSVVIDGNASETIDGATTLTLSTTYEWATLVCDGTVWSEIS